MPETYAQETGNEELWHTIFADGHPELAKQHTLHMRLPGEPRCRLCFAPFGGLGGLVMRWRGKAPSSRNPYYCSACDGFLETFPGGAEVGMSMLYVDIRNSVAAAEAKRPAEVHARVNRFVGEVTRIITEHDGFLIAFYGDCIAAVWPPGFSGKDHAAKALAAARQIVSERIEHGGDDVPVGVSLHTGPVFIGTIQGAGGAMRDISVFGHHVNLTARLAQEASAGEALASEDIVKAAGETLSGKPRELTLKGISQPVAAHELRA